MKLHVVSLGCARNTVDSEMMLGRLAKAGLQIEDKPDRAEVIIINTCSFIEPAINESIDTILQFAEFKKMGTCKQLIVAGCLPERFREKIADTLPEVDFFLGTGAFDEIVRVVENVHNTTRCYLPSPDDVPYRSDEITIRPISSHLAYVKVAEGCDRHCTYCIIPKLRGRQRSRPLHDIISEAKFLIASGVKELVLVAQDTTSYGKDLFPPLTICHVLEEVAKISDGIWIRVLYGYPESIDTSFIQAVGSHKNICSYFDIPIQHASDSVLKKMGRAYKKDDLYLLFDGIRSGIEEVSFRTTLITGFPGETENDFIEMLAFIEDVQFDHLGVFKYSDFEDLPSHRISGHVPVNVAEERYHALMTRQMAISFKKNQLKIGKTFDVLVEKQVSEKQFAGRTRYQAPEVDGVTYIHANQLKEGTFVDLKITDALEYDLIGDVM